MTIQLHDRANIEGVKRLADGRLTAVAKFARSGVQSYTGAEVGRPDLGTVKVYRPDDEVFAADAMASFAHKAITLGHPTESVSAANWSTVAVGFTEGRVARDGGFVVIPMMVADAAAVAAIDGGTGRELSAGYSCDLVWGAGTTPTGEAFDATQVGIRGNHIALVPAGRAGASCRFGDSAQTAFTDAEQSAIVARAEMIHSLGAGASAFSDAQATAAIQATATQRSAAEMQVPPMIDAASLGEASAVTARAMMIADMTQGAR